MTQIHKKTSNIQLTYKLNHAEFACKCTRLDCHYTVVSDTLLYSWTKLRKQINKPIIITSGFRCQGHNFDSGGVRNSYHTIGEAIDLMPNKDTTLKELTDEAKTYFSLVIPYTELNFIHCQNYLKGE